MLSKNKKNLTIVFDFEVFGTFFSRVLKLARQFNSFFRQSKKYYARRIRSRVSSPAQGISKYVLIHRRELSEYNYTTAKQVYGFKLSSVPTKIETISSPSGIREIVLSYFIQPGTLRIRRAVFEGYFSNGNTKIESFKYVFQKPALNSLERPSYWIDVRIPVGAKFRGYSSVDLYLTDLQLVPEKFAKKAKCSYMSVQTKTILDNKKPPLILLLSFDGITSMDLHRKDKNGEASYPGIYKFKKDCIEFSKGISSATVTASAAACLMSGIGVSRHWIYEYDKRYYERELKKMSPDIVTVPEMTKSRAYSNYAMTFFAKWSPHFGWAHAFDEYSNVCTGQVHHFPFMKKSIELLSKARETNSFVFLHLPGGHPPFIPELMHDSKPVALSLYEANLRYTDHIVMAINGYLKECGLYDDSLIMLVSDHGRSVYPYNLRSYQFREDRLRVPLYIKPPAGGQRLDKYRSVADKFLSVTTSVYEIIADVLDIKLPEYYKELSNREYAGTSWLSESVDYSSLKRFGLTGYDDKYKWVLYFQFDKDKLSIGEIENAAAYSLNSDGFADDAIDVIHRIEIARRREVIAGAKEFLQRGHRAETIFQPYVQKMDTFGGELNL